MVNKRGEFTLELVEAYRRFKCQEETDASSGEVFALIDPNDGRYLVRIGVTGGGAADQTKFLFYVNVNDLYIGYRQCLCQQDGLVDVGLYSFSDCGTLIGTNEPMRFQEARLLEKGGDWNTIGSFMEMAMDPATNNSDSHETTFHTNILHMGKVTVKIYEAVMDRRTSSAFGNNLTGDEAYQPGRFVQTITLHCGTSPELGHSYLSMTDSERLKKALMKRPAMFDENTPAATTTTSAAAAEEYRPSFKRMRTENGFVGVMQQSSSNAGHGGGGIMALDMVMHPHPPSFA